MVVVNKAGCVTFQLSGVSSQYWQLVLLRMLTAAGEAALRPAGGSLIAELFPPDQRGIANGIFSWGVSKPAQRKQ